MAYVKITNYSAKDALVTGNPAKLIKGVEVGADFDAVASASTISDANIALRATIASPTFTGVPAAPTAVAGTDTTQIATTAHVFAERANALTLTNKTISLGSNTLTGTSAQLATAISDETGTGALVFAGSPTLTGVPIAPTAAADTNTTQLATTAFVTTADNLKANLASPSLTGTATLVNQETSGTATFAGVTINGTLDMNTGSGATITGLSAPVQSTDAATKAYVDTSISNLIGAAPGALDTLVEIATSLSNNATLSDTLVASIATKLALAGGTMSGVIDMGANKITNLPTPTAGNDAVRLTYVTDLFGSTAAAANSAAAAVISKDAAAASALAALTSENNAAASYDSFDDRYLGAKASAPTLDNDGNALITGALYFDTVINRLRVWDGAAWQTTVTTATGVSSLNTLTGDVVLKTINSAALTGAGDIVVPTGSGSANGTNTGDNTVCTSGAATTAVTLLTPRAINGVNFDGSSAITVTADANTLSGTELKSTVVTSSLTSVGTITTGVWNGTDVAVADGGTGASTLAANAVLLGNGTSTLQTVAPSTSGNVLTSNGTTWTSAAAAGTAPVFGRVVRTAGNITTTSTTLVDVTGATVTLTTGAFPVAYGAAQTTRHDTLGTNTSFNVDVDGSLQHGTTGFIVDSDVANNWVSSGFSGQTAALSAGSHTIKELWLVDAGTGTIKGDTTNNHLFYAQEIR